MRAYLLLGRNGDLTNLLPVLQDEASRTGSPVPLVVAQSYAPLLEGVSYVRPEIFPGDFFEAPLAKAWAQTRLRGYEIIDCSVYGRMVNPTKRMSSFNREIWRLSRTELNFDHASLTFDRRDPARERELMVPYGSGPLILFAGAGTSSPFEQAPAYLEALRRIVPAPYTLVDISNLKAHRPYDLLGLYEQAAALVAIDSFPLHLAQATPDLPVLALLCDGPSPWHRSAWRPNHVVRRLYSEALANVEADLAQVLKAKRPSLCFVSTRPGNLDAVSAQRYARARESREREMRHNKWTEFWFEPVRTATVLKDAPLPFVRDAAIAAVGGGHDVIVLANADIGFPEGLTGRILETVQRFGCAFAHRWDYHVAALRHPPRHEGDMVQTRWYAGSDLFAFTPEWWMKHGHPDFPDMVWGREAWDLIMRNLMKRAVGPDCELHKAIWHEKHASAWERNGRLGGNEHNRRLAAQWIARFGGNWNDWRDVPSYR